ncbi:MAG: phospholipid carrier-dependent glycosyltransferase [Victivallaceae bacterium]|nr:phospholipid carrier-dependent glycosyltransferase [Victivallaceae bacterium]
MQFHKKLLLLAGALLLLRAVFLVLLPLSDPSEARYSLIIKLMAESKNYLEPQLIMGGEQVPFAGKPPLYFQAGGVASELFGVTLFAARLPAFLAAVLLLAMVYLGLRKISDPVSAAAAVLLTISGGFFFLLAGVVMTDMLLALAVTAGIFFYMLFSAETEKLWKKAYSIGFFASLGVGMLVKGPVALVMAGLPVFFFVALNKRWGELRNHAWIVGSAVFLLIAAPWFVLMAQKDPGFLEYFFLNENFKRFLFKEYGDRYGAGRETFRGMALVWFVVANLPALVLLMPALRNRWRTAFGRDTWRNPATALPLLGCLCITGFWCLTSRVLVTYLLPTAPLAASWIALQLKNRGFWEEKQFQTLLVRAGAMITVLLGISLTTVMLLGPQISDKMPEKFYRELLLRADATAELREKSFYFAEDVPFSARVYLPAQKIRKHPDEYYALSCQESKKDILCVRDKVIRKNGAPPKRRLLFRRGRWQAYAPEESKQR